MLTVAAFYKFTPFDDPAAIRPTLADICAAQGVKGSVLLAPEGINGTIAGTSEGVNAVLAAISALPGCADLEWKESPAPRMPFRKMKVRLKREIVTMRQPDVDPRGAVGRYVPPSEWNELIKAPDVVVIDTRNEYEVAIGTFEGALDPQTRSFAEFPQWWEANRHKFHNKRVAMFCTGGIRCEKSTSFLVGQGMDEVYHLQGGILKYLEQVPAEESLWRGECYVFDGRVSVGHGLAPGAHVLCHACGRPVSPQDRNSPDYEEGVQCPACVGEYSDSDRARFRERQRQITLAKRRETG